VSIADPTHKKGSAEQELDGPDTTTKGSAMTTGIKTTVPPFTKPEWAESVEDLNDAAGAVKWVRDVHADSHLDIDLTQFQDSEGADQPSMRIWIDGNMVEQGQTPFTPEAVAEIGVGLVVASQKAQAALAADVVTFERDEPARAGDAVFESAFTHWHHCVTVTDDGAVTVTPAIVDGELTVEAARAYLVELAHAIAIAEAAS